MRWRLIAGLIAGVGIVALPSTAAAYTTDSLTPSAHRFPPTRAGDQSPIAAFSYNPPYCATSENTTCEGELFAMMGYSSMRPLVTGDFRVLGDPTCSPGITVQPAHCTFWVFFEPRKRGMRTGSVSFNIYKPDLTAQLSGVGLRRCHPQSIQGGAWAASAAKKRCKKRR